MMLGFFTREETRLTNAIKAIARIMGGGGLDKTAPLYSCAAAKPMIDARATIHTHRLKHEKTMKTLAEQLPVYAWSKSVRGIGALTIAQIVGEAGALSNYSNPAKLWKRFGLAVIDGRAQRRIAASGPSFRRAEKVAEAAAHGFAPARRALMHVVGENLLRQNGATGSYYRLYVDRKKYEIAKAPDLPLIAHHRRAMRYMEKRFLRDLWAAWRAARPNGNAT